MTDPRTILAAAGVSLPEVEEYAEATSDYNRDADRRILSAQASSAFFVMDRADAALDAVAKELAKIETQRKSMECCGTCSNFDSFGSATFCRIECPERIHAFDHERSYDGDCQYSPSQWEPAFYDVGGTA